MPLDEERVSMTKEPKLEHSDLSGEFEDDGVTVLVDIHRAAGSNDGWTLEVISQEEDVTTWEDSFATDNEAWEEFLATTERDGIRSFLGDDDSKSVH